ncbi:MAG: hypothetical protein MUE84_16985 [Hyphomonas sp.]|jgi:hypothetical protein|nr:hypothetical protein [Hyphomonas sp.]
MATSGKLWIAAAGLGLALSVVPASAQEGAVMRGLLSGLGLIDQERPSIDYRQRAPLVLPPGNALPAPREAAASRNPNWPNDPDVARARAAGEAGRAPIVRLDEGRTLTNAEVRQQSQGSFWGGGPVDATRQANSPIDTGRRLTADEMRVRPIWTEVGSLFGRATGTEDERIQFTGEAPRQRLVEPPPGYRTPSPDAPFGPVGRRPDDPNSAAAQSSAASRSRQDPGATGGGMSR